MHRTFSTYSRFGRYFGGLLVAALMLGVGPAWSVMANPLPEGAAPDNIQDLTLRHDGTDTEQNLYPASFIKGRVTKQFDKYLLGPGDKVNLKVEDLTEFNQVFDIRPDGYASIHPFGEIRISGTDVRSLELWLEEKFKYYLIEPNVTVSVDQMRDPIVYVLGAVNQPGEYQFIERGAYAQLQREEVHDRLNLTMATALLRAGGLKLNADARHIQILHTETGLQEDFDLITFLQTGEGGHVILRSGDRIVVPERVVNEPDDEFKLLASSNYSDDNFPVVVLGAVEKQGEVAVKPNNNTVNAAIGLAGGFKDYAKLKTVYIRRAEPDGSYRMIEVNRTDAEVTVLPRDVI